MLITLTKVSVLYNTEKARPKTFTLFIACIYETLTHNVSLNKSKETYLQHRELLSEGRVISRMEIFVV